MKITLSSNDYSDGMDTSFLDDSENVRVYKKDEKAVDSDDELILQQLEQTITETFRVLFA